MAVKRQRRSPEFKTKVALTALKGDKTLAQLSSEFGVSAVQISHWKKQLLQRLPEVFQQKGQLVDVDALTAPLYSPLPGDQSAQDGARLAQKKSGADS